MGWEEQKKREGPRGKAELTQGVAPCTGWGRVDT